MADDGGKRLYIRARIAGLLLFLPVVLASGPLAGFFLGSYLEGRFRLSPYTTIILVTLGIIASIRETIRIIKMALNAAEDEKRGQV